LTDDIQETKAIECQLVIDFTKSFRKIVAQALKDRIKESGIVPSLKEQMDFFLGCLEFEGGTQ